MNLSHNTSAITSVTLAAFAVSKESQKPERALVVDDEKINRLMLIRILAHNGIAADEAATGKEALAAIAERQYSLVLLDISMPGMDGFETLVNIRESKCESELPVVMVTSASDRENIIKAFDFGANDYLTKPLDAGITVARVKTQLKLQAARTALAESQERFALAVLGSRDGIWDWNLTSNEVFYSPRWKTMLGLPENYPIDSPEDMLDRVHPDDQRRVRETLQRHIEGNLPYFETEVRVQHHGESFRWMLFRGQAFHDESGKAVRLAGSLTDITEGKVVDALTGLPNRLMFNEQIMDALDGFRRDASRLFCVMYLDLDNFKLVNDSHGHQAGDELLLATAHRLSESLRRCETMVARLGGDEFAVLVQSIDDPTTPGRIAERILKAMEKPFALKCGSEVFAGISIGLSMASDRSDTKEDLLREADTAMYQAKASGKHCFRVYDPQMHDTVRRRLCIENDLRAAIDRDELVLHFQPLVNLADNRATGAEALVRWNHPTRGLIMPSEFIPIAEETGLILPIGQWVFREACERLASWMPLAPQFEDFRVHVNFSTRQFSDTGLLGFVRETLNANQLSGHQLGVEITESFLAERAETAKQFLDDLSEMGLSISIDDFGTGYSSFASLRHYPIDVIKIDRSFIEHIDRPGNNAIVRAICELADGLGLRLLAEGIQSQHQANAVRELGCEYGQGYFLSPPLSSHELVDKLLANDFCFRTAD